jgi:hypothetical protein
MRQFILDERKQSHETIHADELRPTIDDMA